MKLFKHVILTCILCPVTIFGTISRQPYEEPGIILKNKKIAILVADGFEQAEMTEPRKALEKAGAKTYVISPSTSQVKSWKSANWAQTFPVDIQLSAAKAADYDALLLPGGVMNPDHLRTVPAAVKFVEHFVKAKKPIAAICHGPWTLINARGVKNHRVTSWPSLQADLENAGAIWVNKPVVTDGTLVTSRKPEDVPHFNKAMIKLFSTSTTNKNSYTNKTKSNS